MPVVFAQSVYYIYYIITFMVTYLIFIIHFKNEKNIYIKMEILNLNFIEENIDKILWAWLSTAPNLSENFL